jgi:hypothetical protein
VLTIHLPLPEARKPRRIQIGLRNLGPSQRPHADHTAIESNTGSEDFEADAPAESHTEEPALAGAGV